MKKYHTLVAGGAFLMLCAGPAAAGPCTQQINQLTGTLGWNDAGSGPTPGAASSTTRTVQAPAHPPTDATKKAMEGKAASAHDANRQTTGHPTAADQALGTQSPVSNDESAARAALDRARTLDAQSNEECKKLVLEAKHLVGFDE